MNAHAPLWVTVTVCPATVSVPVRDVVAVFAATVYVTLPLPVPLPPAVTVIQLALLVAPQAHAVVVVTVVVRDPAAAATASDVGETVKLQVEAKVKVFDGALGVEPLGPTAATSAT